MAEALTVDGGEEAGAQVVVQVLVLAHLKHFLPLLLRHLALDALRRLLLVPQLLSAKLRHEKAHFRTAAAEVAFGNASVGIVGAVVLHVGWSGPRCRPGRPVCRKAL